MKDGHNEVDTGERKLIRDEENRLLAVDDNGYVSLYWYDADGNRTVRERHGGEAVWVNSEPGGMVSGTPRRTVTPGGFITFDGTESYTEHVYIGGERVASIRRPFSTEYYADNVQHLAGVGLGSGVDYSVLISRMRTSAVGACDSLGVPWSSYTSGGNTRGGEPTIRHILMAPAAQDGDTTRPRTPQPDYSLDSVYYYHRDHLGGTMTVTDGAGAPVQQVEYTPWGEVFVELHNGNSGFTTPYLFNGKELDEETGLYYYGARYYDPKMSVWYSTDPMHNIKPFISDYSYCFSNPFSITDPSGMLESTDVIKNNDGTYKIVGVHKDGDNNIYIVNQNGIRTGETIGSTIRPYDFMGTNDENGTFTNKTGIIIDLNNLYVSGTVHTENAEYSIYHANANDLLDWGMSIFREELKYDSYRTFYSELQILRRLSKDGEALDIKRSMGLDPYTPVRAGTNSEGKPIITTLRAVGNYLFGANVKSTKPLLFPNDMFYKSVMKKVGAYNQQQNHGNGYNPGFPYYGEHTYSGSFIYYGYYGRFY